MTSGNWPAAAV